MKLLTAVVSLLSLFAISNCIAQAPSIEWQKYLGGGAAKCIQQTTDGGYIVAGNDSNISVVKLTVSGSIQWQKSLGGSSNEEANCIQQTTDGGYIIAGSTTSNDGDVTGNHVNDDNSYYADFWVVKLTATGSVQWQKCLGGSDAEVAYSVQQTTDGGYIVAGSTGSYNDGDVNGYHIFRSNPHYPDYWVVKLTSTGNIQWQKCLGGHHGEEARSIQQTLDGGYIVAGYTRSRDGDVSGIHNGQDCWVVKLTSTGNIQWQKCLGGGGWEFAQSIHQTLDGGYIVAGATDSYDGDVSGLHYGPPGFAEDYWVVKLTSTGNIQWQKCLGGISDEEANSIQQTTDGGYIVAGISRSNDGDVSGNHGNDEFWIVKLTDIGGIQWQKCLGGTSDDDAYSICQTKDGGYIVAGVTDSNDGDVSGSRGQDDSWVVKLSPERIKAELKWDKSFPDQSLTVKGVAADGVSRVYLKISKADSTTASTFQTVVVSLTDGVSTSTSLLGKVQQATTTDSYSTEANDASSITATSTASQNGDYWFWYVAPDDFSDNASSAFANASEREVKAHIVVTFTDGTKDSTDIPVKIVRPPLVMVHGLAGSEHSWDSFNDGNGTLFINSPLFKQKRAVSLYPHAPYDINANTLLSPDGTGYSNASNRLNTLQGNIEELRKQGYACNQVDYVCHSMGGCVLRTAITTYQNKYYGLTSEPYKNYGKGFVHKAIIISTPHNNSPVADAVTEFVPQAPKLINVFFLSIYSVYPKLLDMFDFIEPTNLNNPIAPWQSTLAVTNLQVSDEAGGKNMAATDVKNHLIAGDVDIYDASTASTVSNLHEYDRYIELLDKVLKIMRDKSVGSAKVFLNGLLGLEKSVRALSFLEWYSTQKGFTNFLGDGDLIVPLSSQLARLSTTSPNVTVFNNTSLLNANHLKIKDRTDVGNKVKELLNSQVSSNLFSNTIPATPGVANRLASPQLSQRVSGYVQNEIYDTTKVKIVTPVFNSTLPADSVRFIQVNLKDTNRLAYLDVSFQGKTYTSISRSSLQSFSLKVDSSFLGNMSVSATAIYDQDNGTDYHTDTVSVSVFTNATLTGFTAKEDTNYIYKGQPFYPTYTASYTNYNAGIPANSPDLIVTITNTSLLQYNTVQHAFYAIADTGTTKALINYKTYKDTIAFVLLPTLNSGCTNRTTGNASLRSIANWSRSVVPATCDSVVVMPGHTLVIDSSVQIRSLYISAGATVLLQDSTLRLQIGETDAGGQPLMNYGTLNITKGKIAINGSLQLMAGSNFTMTGGELMLDGNTGFNETSLANGANIFDVSNSMNSFSFTGGTLQIIDPPISNNSQAINCPYNFGDNTTLLFGNGISTTASNNPNGFGGNLMPAKIGKLIIDAASATNNRLFINPNPITVKSAIQVKSGNLVQKALINVIQ